MENLNDELRKEYSLKKSPWYFGAYLNQARHNLYICLNDITEKIGGSPVPDDGQILGCKAMTMLEKEDKPIEREKVMEYLDQKLPFLYSMYYKYSPEEEKHLKKEEWTDRSNLKPAMPHEYADILKSLVSLLSEARNHFSHYTDEPFKVSPETIYLLNDAYDVNVRIAKARLKLDENKVNHLRRLKSAGRNEKPKANPAFRYYFMDKQADGNYSITEYGLAFLASLFLPKGEAFLFLKKISGLKRGETPDKRASVEAFCASCIQLPKERMKSDISAQALFLDMCNELGRCPNELYEHLEPNKQELFISAINEEEIENNTSDEMEEESDIEREVKLVRKNNRFTFFAQRYLDVNKAFPSLRFGIDIGVFYYSIYPKEIAGIPEMRRLTKKLTGYGRLEDFDEEMRERDFKKLYAERSSLSDLTEPYIRETYPHYDVNNNLIPLYFAENEDKGVWPVIDTIPTNGEKSYPNKLIKDKEPKPAARLSTEEMPMLLFYHLLQSKEGQGAGVQAILTEHMHRVKTFFTDLNKGILAPVDDKPIVKPTVKYTDTEYNRRYELLEAMLDTYKLKPAHVPEKVLNYLLGVKQPDIKGKNIAMLRFLLDEAKERIRKMELREEKAQKTKPGKKNFRKVKVGRLADILATDMMMMQPVAKDQSGNKIPGSKANSTVYRLIQSSLAFFSINKESLRAVVEEAGLVDSANPHPFLRNVGIERHQGIIEFYQAYFAAKVTYLESCLRDQKFSEYSFLKNPAHDPDIRKLTDAYLNKAGSKDYSPFNLPRGLYLDACLRWFREYGSEDMKSFVSSQGLKINSVHLLDHYFKLHYHDGEQDFYHWKRAYTAYEKGFGPNRKPLFLDLTERIEKSKKLKHLSEKYKKENDTYRTAIERAIKDVAKQLKSRRTGREIQELIVGFYLTQFPEMRIETDRIDSWKVESKIKSALKECPELREKAVRDYKFFMENEKFLRLVSTEDKLLFLCIQDMLLRHTGGLSLKAQEEGIALPVNTFLLKNIGPGIKEDRKNILDCTPANGIMYKMNYYETLDDGNYRKEDGKKVIAGMVSIEDRHLKIKNAGNFKKLLRDRRLNNLFYYFKANAQGEVTLNRMILENELREYEKQRLEVLEAVALFEKALYDTTEDKSVFINQKGAPDHALYLEHFFQLYPEMDNDSLKLNLRTLRNAFMHNQFPLLRDKLENYSLAAEEWLEKNRIYSPATVGSTLGYGIVNKLSVFAGERYRQLHNKITNG